MTKNEVIGLYSAALVFLLLLMKWLEYRFEIVNTTFEIYIGLIALLFTSLGIWLTLKLTRPKIERIIVEKKVYVPNKSSSFELNQTELNKLQLSKRELEVSQLMAAGLSNQEIATQLFVSLNILKSYSSKLFEKLEVARRTQAVYKAKKLHPIP